MKKPIIVILSLVTLLLAACGQHEYVATLYDEPRSLGSYELVSTTGETVETGNPNANLTVYYFGYTFCPDFCPTTMLDLSRAYNMLSEAEQEQVEIVMVSVDPDRDTLAQLETYTRNFDEAFVGYRTDDRDELDAMVFDFGATYSYTDVSEESAAEYLVNHTTALFLVDGNGDLLGVMTYGKTADEIAADIQELLRDVS